MNLYLIEGAMASLIDENGEITDEEKFMELLQEKDTAIQNLSSAYLNAMAEGDAIDAQIARLESLKKDNEKRQMKIAEHIRLATGEENWKNECISISFRKTQRVEITDKDKIPQEYMTQPKPPKPVPDKVKIGKAIENGEVVEGAELIKYKSMNIK